MKGLLIKDWYMMLKYGKTLILFIVFYGIFGAIYGNGYMAQFFTMFEMLLASMMVKQIMAYEEQSKWNCMAVQLPVTAKQLVKEKYLLGLICVTVTGVVVTLILWFVNYDMHNLGDISILPVLVFSFTVGMLMLELELPLLFKLGVTQGRVWFTIVTMAVAGLGGAMGATWNEMMLRAQAALNPFILYVLAGVLLVIAAGWFISIRMAVKFYTNREF